MFIIMAESLFLHQLKPLERRIPLACGWSCFPRHINISIMTYDYNLCRFPTPAVSAHFITSLGNIMFGQESWWKSTLYVAQSVDLDTAANVDPVNIYTVQCCISSKVFVFHMFIMTEKNIYKFYKSTNAL